MQHAIMLGCAATLLIVASGCERSDPERVIVAGEVTYLQEPVMQGFIRFIPITQAPTSGAQIVDGEYKVDFRGGVPAGKHKVWIEGYIPDLKTPNGGLDDQNNKNLGVMDGVPRRFQYLPRQFNYDSTLVVTIDAGAGSVAKDFHLE